MRRRLLVGAVVLVVALAVGSGVLIGRNTTNTRAKVLGSSITRPTTTAGTQTVTIAPATTAPSSSAITPGTQPPPATSPPPSTSAPRSTSAPQTAPPTTVDCGSGDVTARISATSASTGTDANPSYTTNGTVTVSNGRTNDIQLDRLVVRIVFADGTYEDAPVDAATGAVVGSGRSTSFAFQHTSSKRPTSTAHLAAFDYHPVGLPNC
jgi:cytoskeletal protein RodZ